MEENLNDLEVKVEKKKKNSILNKYNKNINNRLNKTNEKLCKRKTL